MDNDLIFHYYLKNPLLHQLNARLVNNNQANIISIIEMISEELGIGVEIDVLATKEGGLKDILRLKPKTTGDRWVTGISAFVIAILVNIVSDCLTQDRELSNLQKEYYSTQLEEIKRKNQLDDKQNAEIDKLKQRISFIETTQSNVKIKQKRSAIYKQMDTNGEIISFAVEQEISSEEIKTLAKVDKKDFCQFIISEPQRIIETDEDATIEIISPVLNNSKYKWRGIYNDSVIEFSVKDKEFKNKIFSEDLQFGSNNILSAKLEIRKDIDEYGNEKISSYAVIEVFGTELKNGYIEMPKTSRKRLMEKQMDLFSYEVME